MKKIITLILALLPLVAFSQQPTKPLPHNVLNPQDTTIKLDHAAYQAHDDFSYYLKKASNHISTSVLLNCAGAVSAIIGTQQKDVETAKIFYVAGAGLAIVGIVLLLNAGLDLSSAADAHRRIHPIPNGVSIDLN